MILPPHHRAAIIAHARGQAPQEACGVLAGAGGRVRRTYPLRNTSATPLTNYLADPEQQLKAFVDAERRGLEHLATYHSHPGSEAYPSETDVALAYYPQAWHLIVSLAGGRPKLRCFAIVSGHITEEPITQR
jgi:[CysO sulfur-carrier protein]-S-L-cysteine hydrolase